MKFGVDYFSQTSELAAFKEHGVEFVARYLAPPGNAKNITKAEAQAVEKAALGLVSVWEENGDEPFQGQNRGVQDARLALAEATAAGMPKGSPIYFALDRDPSALSAAQWAAVEGYWKGAASVLGVKCVGAYGGLALIKRLFDKKLVAYGWQTYAWSGGLWDTRAQLRQYLNAQTIAGVSVDFDHALTSDYGQWTERNVVKPIRFYHLTFRDEKGHIRQQNTRHPIRFQMLHRHVREHRVTQTPVR